MSYCMDLIESDLCIKNENKEKCFREAKRSLLKNVNRDGSSYDYHKGEVKNKSYAWIENSEIENSKSLEELLSIFCYNPELDKGGSIIGVCFNGEKLGDDEHLFNAIAPFVEAGSYIEMSGEDSCRWRWHFDGERMVELNAKISWE